MTKYSWCPVGVLNAVLQWPLPKTNHILGFSWLSAAGQYLRRSEAMDQFFTNMSFILCIISPLDLNRDRVIHKLVILMIKEWSNVWRMFLLTPKESTEVLTLPEDLFPSRGEFQLAVKGGGPIFVRFHSSTGFQWIVVVTDVASISYLIEKVTTITLVLLTFCSRHELLN